MKLIFDSHLDLAFNALQIRRDLTEDISTNRSRDDESILARVGLTTVSLPELRRGGVAIVCATVMSRIDPSDKQTLAGMYTQSQCYGIGRGHAAYYQALEKLGELSIIRSNEDLDACLARWASNADPPLHPVRRLPAGLILTMESADPILNPDSVPEWHGLGLRMVSLAHYGTSTYSHGTGTEGGLLPTAKPLVDALQAHRIALDMTHLTEQAFWELLDLYDGPVAATHHNCRSLVPRQRQLTDKMIKAIAARDGVIGTACDVWMLDPDWDQSQPRGTQKTSATLESFADHMDHIAQLTGTVRHCGIGSDLDGGYGREQSPKDLDTIADLQKLAPILTRRGYTPADLDAIFSGNWLRFMRDNVLD